MNGTNSFFLFCAGADQSILKRTPTDVNKYASIGATVFFTGLFASIAGGFALFSVFKSVIISILFGAVWGLMIFNLDRYIVMSIKKKDSRWKEFTMALPRLVLAVLIAFVIAKPLELKLFESEINSELVLMEQERFKEQETMLRTRFTPEVLMIQGEIDALNSQIEVKRAKRDELNQIAIAEADGTGGSGQRNLGPIYKAKKRDADLAQQELNITLATLNPEIESKRNQIKEIESSMNSGLNEMDKVKLDGFAARLDALGNLSEKSTTIFWASIFITLLFIAIETAPLFVKLISERSPYDFRLDQHETLASNIHSSYVNKLNTVTQNENRFFKQTEKYQTLEAISAEKELIKKVIETEVGLIKEKPLTWQEYRNMGRRFG
ncbi:MAG: DUF4407 domain-containing protein [Saprospiraceae bacterium]|nr:DUF4407 domain-containing protein [Saprospiraceae bacterium]